MWKNGDVPRSDVPPKSNLVLQSPTTPGQFICGRIGQFHMWKNADIPRSDVPPVQTSSGEEEYYKRTALPVICSFAVLVLER